MTEGSNSALSIGAVIYVLSNKAQKVVPAIVVEEVLVKKLDGNHISWKVSVGPPGKERIVDSNRLDGVIYPSLEDVRAELHKRLESFLDEMILEAEKRVENWYGKQTAQLRSAQGISEDPNDKIDPDNLISDIEAPPQQSFAASSRAASASTSARIRDEVRRRAEAMADPDHPMTRVNQQQQELHSGESVVSSEEVVLPDGKRVRINLKG